MEQLCTFRRQARHLFLFAFLLPAAFLSQAQNNQSQPVYIMLTYMKTNPGKFNDYERLLHMYSKKIYSYLVQQHNDLSWSAYEVLMPSGTSAEYNVVSVTVSNKVDELLDPSTTGRDVFSKVFTDMNAQQADTVMQRFAEVRNMVKREIYVPLSTTNENGPPTKTPTKYVETDFMTPVPGKESQYVKMEQDIFRPVHKQRIVLNALKGWGLYQKIMPSDTNDSFPYMTANFFDDFSGIMDPKYAEAIKKALPNQDVNKLVQYMNSVKKGQRDEVWKLIEYDDASTK